MSLGWWLGGGIGSYLTGLCITLGYEAWQSGRELRRFREGAVGIAIAWPLFFVALLFSYPFIYLQKAGKRKTLREREEERLIKACEEELAKEEVLHLKEDAIQDEYS